MERSGSQGGFGAVGDGRPAKSNAKEQSNSIGHDVTLGSTALISGRTTNASGGRPASYGLQEIGGNRFSTGYGMASPGFESQGADIRSFSTPHTYNSTTGTPFGRDRFGIISPHIITVAGGISDSDVTTSGSNLFGNDTVHYNTPASTPGSGLGPGLEAINTSICNGINARPDINVVNDAGIETQGPASMWSIRSGCTENDDFFNPTPAESQYGKELRAAAYAEKHGLLSPPKAPFEYDNPINHVRPLPRGTQSSSDRGITTSSAIDSPIPVIGSMLPAFLSPDLGRLNEELEKNNIRLEQKCKDLEKELMMYREHNAAKDETLADLIKSVAFLEGKVLSHDEDNKSIQTFLVEVVNHLRSHRMPQPFPAIVVPKFATSANGISVAAPKQRPTQGAQPAGQHHGAAGSPNTVLSTPTVASTSDSTKVYCAGRGADMPVRTIRITPTLDNDTDTLHITPNPSDDVFGEDTLNAAITLMSLNAGGSPKKSMNELFTSFFKKVEGALRPLVILDLVQKGRRCLSDEIFKLASEHLMSQKVAVEQLEHKTDRFCVMLGVVCQEIVKMVFEDSVLGNYGGIEAQAFARLWADEQSHRHYTHPRASDLAHRTQLAISRSSYANNIVNNTPGFWKWAQKYTEEVTLRLFDKVKAAFAMLDHPNLKEGLHVALTEGIKIAIRMRQEPVVYEFFFPAHGSRWDGRFLIHRNPELFGQEIPDERCPYVVRCTALPIVKYKDFSAGDSRAETLHKAEVLVGDRKSNIKPTGRQARGGFGQPIL